MRLILSATTFIVASVPALAQDLSGSPKHHGLWSLNCNSQAADTVLVQPNSVTITHAGTPHVYRGVEISMTWFGGARADGKHEWILGSKQPGGMFSFVAQVPGTLKDGLLILDEGADGQGGELRPLLGKKFRKCPKR